MRDQKAEYYNKMEKDEAIPLDFEKTMKDQTLKEVELRTDQGWLIFF